MKETKLRDVYCVPKNQNEWIDLSTHNSYRIPNFGRFLKNRVVLDTGHILGHNDAKDCYLEERIEIQVSKFIDLLEDRIVPWRLEEIGFSSLPTVSDKERWILRLPSFELILFKEMVVFLAISYNELVEMNIKTLTELKQLIKFLTL